MSQIQEIKQATDIIQLIGERITLQRSGNQYRGLCPFHSEKSPSFFVSDQFQRYKCFGCGESGDIFTFLEKYDGMTFAESLQILADRAGITLEKVTLTDEDDQRKRVLELLNLAKEYFHYLLTQHDIGKKAMDYLKDRGVTNDSIKIFQIGYAQPGWDGMLKYLNGKKNYSLADIAAAGLSVNGRTGQTYDRFRDRVMFPLTDHRGRVVGFSGRVLDPLIKEAKYINSPETILYHKSQMLYGFSQLYQSIRKEKEVVVVEGEFDVISSAQAHVNHVVAVKGSALTEEHMRLLSRTVERVLLCFDTDAAGTEATRRAIAVAQPFGMELRVLDFGEEAKKDPDELARNNPQMWRQVVKTSISVYEFLIRASLKQNDPESPEGKRKIVNQLAPIFREMSHAVEREYYVRRLAESLNVKESILQADLQKFSVVGRQFPAKSQPRKSSPHQQKTDANAQKNNEDEQPVPEHTRMIRFEEYIAFLFFHAEGSEVAELLPKVSEIKWSLTGMRQLIAAVVTYTASKPWSLQDFSRTLPEDLQQQVFDWTTQEEFLNILTNMDRAKDFHKEWQKAVTELLNMQKTQEVALIQQRMDELDALAEKTPEQEAEQMELLRKVVQLRQK